MKGISDKRIEEIKVGFLLKFTTHRLDEHEELARVNERTRAIDIYEWIIKELGEQCAKNAQTTGEGDVGGRCPECGAEIQLGFSEGVLDKLKQSKLFKQPAGQGDEETITEILWAECNKKGDLIDKAIFNDGVSIETINNIFANAALLIKKKLSSPTPTDTNKRSLIESILMRYETNDDYGIEEAINALCLLTTVPTEEEIDDKSYRQQCDEQEMEGSYHELDD